MSEAAIILNSCVEPKMQVTITLTSPIIREENMREGGWKAIKHSTSINYFFYSSTLLDGIKP